jgi:hypothetical protein
VVHPGPQAERPPRRLPRVDSRPSPFSRSPSSAPQVGDHLDRRVHGRRRWLLLARISRSGRVGRRPGLGTGDDPCEWFEAGGREESRRDSRGGDAAAEGSGEQRRRCQPRRHGWWSLAADLGIPPAPAMWEG